MKKTLTTAMLMLLFSSAFALTPEQALEQYYSSAAEEDIDAYLAVTDFTGLSQEEIANEKALVEALWAIVDEQETAIGSIEKAVAEDAREALLQYELTSSFKNTNTGEITSFEGLEHVALLSEKSGDWKVVYAMPLEYYLEAREGAERIALVESYVDDMVEDLAQEPDDLGSLMVNGMPYTGPPSLPAGLEGILAILDMAIGTVFLLIALVVALIVIFLAKGLLTKEKKEGAKEKQAGKKEVKPEPVKETSKKETAENAKKEFSEAMKVLRKRYASGEITKEQFNEMKKELEV